jgi:hypothetical protein
VIGDRLFFDSHWTIAIFSYVWPSAAMVGSSMISKLWGRHVRDEEEKKTSHE